MPLLVLRLPGTEIERPLAVVMDRWAHHIDAVYTAGAADFLHARPASSGALPIQDKTKRRALRDNAIELLKVGA